MDTLYGIVASTVGAGVVGWEVGARGEDAKGLGGRGAVGGGASGSAGAGVHEVVHAAARIPAAGVNAGAEVGLCHEGCCAGKVFGDFDLDITQVSFSGCASAFLLVRIATFGCTGGSAFEPAIPVMANERLALVLLGAAVRVDVVDVGKVYLELFLCKRDSVVDVEQSFAPLCEVRRILNQLHATEMSTALFVTAIDIVI